MLGFITKYEVNKYQKNIYSVKNLPNYYKALSTKSLYHKF